MKHFLFFVSAEQIFSVQASSRSWSSFLILIFQILITIVRENHYPFWFGILICRRHRFHLLSFSIAMIIALKAVGGVGKENEKLPLNLRTEQEKRWIKMKGMNGKIFWKRIQMEMVGDASFCGHCFSHWNWKETPNQVWLAILHSVYETCPVCRRYSSEVWCVPFPSSLFCFCLISVQQNDYICALNWTSVMWNGWMNSWFYTWFFVICTFVLFRI